MRGVSIGASVPTTASLLLTPPGTSCPSTPRFASFAYPSPSHRLHAPMSAFCFLGVKGSPLTPLCLRKTSGTTRLRHRLTRPRSNTDPCFVLPLLASLQIQLVLNRFPIISRFPHAPARAMRFCPPPHPKVSHRLSSIPDQATPMHRESVSDRSVDLRPILVCRSRLPGPSPRCHCVPGAQFSGPRLARMRFVR
jgi:hypothetical protein